MQNICILHWFWGEMWPTCEIHLFTCMTTVDKSKPYWVNKVKRVCLLYVVTEARIRVHSGHSPHHTRRRTVFRHIEPVPRAGEPRRLVCIQNRDAHHSTVLKRTSPEEPRVHIWVLHLHCERVGASPLIVHGLALKIKTHPHKTLIYWNSHMPSFFILCFGSRRRSKISFHFSEMLKLPHTLLFHSCTPVDYKKKIKTHIDSKKSNVSGFQHFIT